MYQWRNPLEHGILHCVLVECMDSRLFSPAHPPTGKKKQLTGWKSNCGGVVSNLSNTKEQGNWPDFHMPRTEVKIQCVAECFERALRCLEMWLKTISWLFDISSPSKPKLRRKQNWKKIIKISNEDQISKHCCGHGFFCLNLMNY